LERDEVRTFAAPKPRPRSVLDPLAAKHQVRVFQTAGDGVLLGLSPRIAVHLMIKGDVAAKSEVLDLLAAQEVDQNLLDELATADVPQDLVPALEERLRAAWIAIHSAGSPSPEGFVLGTALARLGSPSVETFLLDRATSPSGSQELAHAVRGLRELAASGAAIRKADVEAVLEQSASSAAKP
jgi:hypothetical protein